MRKSHSKLSSSRDGPSHELQSISTKKMQPVPNASDELAYGSLSENGGQINHVPANRILQIREMKTSFEDRGMHGTGKDEECGWDGSHAATNTRAIL